MNNLFINESMVEAYVYETSQILETLEQLIMQSESDGAFSEEAINEIFRHMHTIKGSSAMMMFNGISTLAHRMEDVFYVIREDKQTNYDFSFLIDFVFESIDFFKVELMKVKESEIPDGDNQDLIKKASSILQEMKQQAETIKSNRKNTLHNKKEDINHSKINGDDLHYYKAKLFFKENSEMENVRAYAVVHKMNNLMEACYYIPKNILENDETAEEICKNGFQLVIQTKEESQKIKDYLEAVVFLDQLEFQEITQKEYQELANLYQGEESIQQANIPQSNTNNTEGKHLKQAKIGTVQQSIISVNVDKLDQLMDMVGELVIAEAMVTQNPEITQLEIESFDKASRQLHKISSELQDLVMSIRMIPLSTTFMKMQRIIRDMSKKLNKNVGLEVFGEETEVDKNVIERISDPLMHIIRNSLDHGIEDGAMRIQKGKDPQGVITLEAKNAGSDVLIIIKDDGKGLDKQALYNKAIKQGLIDQPFEEVSDREIYQLILEPGFSTKEQVTEFSGRGVGMDVVSKNIKSVGGAVLVDSEEGKGTTITLKIPLTLAIIEGMNLKVGEGRFTLPIASIQESFRPKSDEIIRDTEGNEMIMVRGVCYPILRLHEFYDIETTIENFQEGILIMVEEDEKSFCIFADELLGQQKVVVKSLPNYIKKYKQIKGLGGCTLLGDGNISLILDIKDFELSRIK